VVNVLLVVESDYNGVSRQAAVRAVDLVGDRPEAAIIVATGETPMGMYRELATLRHRGEFDPSQWRVFQLDEATVVADRDAAGALESSVD
jgi:glucosamine-6-phosphate deaminase